jgi:DNA-binding winged helix-turn-helix (wHTH) protein
MMSAAIAKHEIHDRPGVLSFPPFRLDLVEERLWKGNREVRLRRKPFAILRFLAQNPRRLVTQGEIVDAVWGRNVAMSESLLRTHMRDLRHALGEAVIETVVGRGYRFVANMGDAGDSGSGLGAAPTDGVVAIAPRVTVHAADLAGKRRLEIVRLPVARGASENRDVTASVSAAHACVVKQLADALAASGTTATVVLIFADGPSAFDADDRAATA